MSPVSCISLMQARTRDRTSCGADRSFFESVVASDKSDARPIETSFIQRTGLMTLPFPDPRVNMPHGPLMIGSWPRAIVHIDGDAFFASCEQAVHPEWKGRAVITGKER